MIEAEQDCRISYMSIGEIYFYTAAINSWFDLLVSDRFKKVIIQSLDYLSSKQLMDIFL